MVLSWIIKAASNKKKPVQNSQPWDKARRRQAESSKPQGSFPNLQDLGKGIREILQDLDEDLLPDETAERKRAYRFETMSEGSIQEPAYEDLETLEDVGYYQKEISLQETVKTGDNQAARPRQGAGLNAQAVVNGVIWSEILQPPRAKRPLKH